MSVVAKLDTKELDALRKKVANEGPELVETVARAVVQDAKMLAAFDTGFMRESIEAEPSGFLTWLVNVWAAYGKHVELGTSRMRAQPFLVPAVEAAFSTYVEAWKRLFK